MTGCHGAERSEENEGEHTEGSQHDQVRVVIVGTDGLVVKDKHGQPGPVGAGEPSTPPLEGHREVVFDLSSNRPVGHVYVDVNSEFLSNESHGFLNALLLITLIGGGADGRRRHRAWPSGCPNASRRP